MLCCVLLCFIHQTMSQAADLASSNCCLLSVVALSTFTLPAALPLCIGMMCIDVRSGESIMIPLLRDLGKRVAQLLGCTTWSGGGPGMMEAATLGVPPHIRVPYNAFITTVQARHQHDGGCHPRCRRALTHSPHCYSADFTTA